MSGETRLKSMRTPLGRVRNLGAAHSGTGDFWRQRITAVAMTLLIVPVLVVVFMLLGRNQAGAAQILLGFLIWFGVGASLVQLHVCLLYTSDAADE